MGKKGPKTLRGKRRKFWTGYGRKSTPEEKWAKSIKEGK